MGTVFVQIALGMNPFVNTQGFAKIGMLTVTIGAVINIVLDPILIFGLLIWVLKVLPLQLLVAQGVSAICGVKTSYLVKKQYLKLRKKYLKVRYKN